MCSPLITASRPRGADRGGESLSREPAALGRAPGGGFDQGKAVSCHVKASGSGSGRRPSTHGLQDPRGATFPSLQVKIRYPATCRGYFSIFLFFPIIIAPKYLFGGVKGPTFGFQIYIFSQKAI